MARLTKRLDRLQAALAARQAVAQAQTDAATLIEMTPERAIAVAEILIATGGFALFGDATQVTPADGIGRSLMDAGLRFDGERWHSDPVTDRKLAAAWLAEADAEGRAVEMRAAIELLATNPLDLEGSK